MTITAKCIGGPKDGELITQPNHCYYFIVDTIEMGRAEKIGEYVQHTTPVPNGHYIEWRFKAAEKLAP